MKNLKGIRTPIYTQHPHLTAWLAGGRIYLLLLGHRLDNVRVSRISDAEGADAEVFSTSSAQFHVVAVVVVHSSLGEHRVVFDLRLPQRRSVIRDDYQLCLSCTKSLQSLFVTQNELSWFHNESQSRIDGLESLLRLLRGHHLGCNANGISVKFSLFICYMMENIGKNNFCVLSRKSSCRFCRV